MEDGGWFPDGRGQHEPISLPAQGFHCGGFIFFNFETSRAKILISYIPKVYKCQGQCVAFSSIFTFRNNMHVANLEKKALE